MDLVSVIAACAMGYDAQVMHALVWNESRGAPWSFRTEVVGEPRVFRTRPEAVRQARRARSGGGALRIGLTRLPLAPERSEAQAIDDAFEPCANVTAAARRLAELQDHCARDLKFGDQTLRCTLALWRGSLTGQGAAFAQAVQADIAAHRLPNFDLDERAGPTEPPPLSAIARRPSREPDAGQVTGSPRDGGPPVRDGNDAPSESDRARHAPLFVEPTAVRGAEERAAVPPSSSIHDRDKREARPAAPGDLFPARPQAVKPIDPPPSSSTESVQNATDPPVARTTTGRPADAKPPSTSVFVPTTRGRGQP